jgi:hypothetical protein
MKIGVMFGSPETTTGGNALKFYASVRLDIRRIGSIKRGDEVIYHIGAYASGCHKADALELYNAGKCILFQRKLGPGKFAYVARKPLKV